MSVVLFFVFALGLLLSVPVTFALALACAAAIVWHGGLPGTIVPQQIVAAIDTSPLLAIPLFILFGEVVSEGTIGRRLVALGESLVGCIRGGLAHANILASMFFGGISGAATADTAAIGSVMVPEMKRSGYPGRFAAVVTCTSSVMGNLIPPSIDLIIYAWLTGTPVDKLFAAGIVPAVMLGLGMMLVAYQSARRHGYGKPRPFRLREVGSRFSGALAALGMPLLIIGGILGGYFTVTESAALAVVYGLGISLFWYRDLSVRQLPGIFCRAAMTIGSVMFLLGTAAVFSWIMTRDRLPQNLSAFLVDTFPSPWLFVFNVVLIGLLSGLFLTPATALIVLTPILYPTAMALGFDAVHFGILLISSLALGHVTPPVGLTLFIGASLAKEPVDALIRPLAPFFAVLVLVVLLIGYVPAATLLLPGALG